MSFDRFLKPPIKKKKKSTSGFGKKKEVNDDLDDFFPVKKAMRPKGPKKKAGVSRLFWFSKIT